MIKFKCPTCGTDAWIPDALMEVAQMDSKIQFFCGYGHPSHFKMNKKQLEDKREKEAQSTLPTEPELSHQSMTDNIITFPKRG